MSRRNFVNERFEFVVGTDNTTGAFMQVWEQPADEQDCPLLTIDNQGVTTYGDIPEVSKLILETQDRFKKSSVKFPNIDAETVCRFAEKLGFKIPRKEIYEILD